MLGPNHPDTADSQVYLAGLNLVQGRYAEAEELLLAAAPNEPREISARHPTPGESYLLLGSLYLDLGDLERAEQNAQISVDILEEVLAPDHPEIGHGYNSLAIIAYRRGDYERADRLAKRVLAVREAKFGRYHGFTGDSLLFLSRIAKARGDQAEANRYLEETIEVYEKVLGADNYRTLWGKMSLAWLKAGEGKKDESKALCEEILASPRLHLIKELEWEHADALRRHPLRRGAARGGDPVRQAGGQHHPGTARRHYHDGRRVAEDLRAGARCRLPDLGLLLGRSRPAAGSPAGRQDDQGGRAFRFRAPRCDARLSAREPARATPPAKPTGSSATTGSAGSSRRSARSTTISCRRRRPGLHEVDEARLQELRDQLRVAKRAFRDFLAQLIAEFEAGSPQRAMEIGEKNLKNLKSLQGTLRELGEGVVLIHYLITDSKLHILVTTGRVQIVRSVAVGGSELNWRVNELALAFASLHTDPVPLAQELYKIIFEPIAEDLRQAEAQTLMFSLDGVLRYLPMAALHDGEGYLIEDYEVVLFTEAAESKLTADPPDDWRMAGLGVTRAVEGFSPLPAVAEELDSIVRTDSSDADGVLPGVIYLDEAFSQEAIEDSLDEEYPALHVASHFVFQPGTERDSYLLLGDGGRLSLAEVLDYDLDFNAVSLLTLSACQTALGGAGADGREIEGFGWLAQRQGAKSVLATLWPVADKSTAEFMSTLYGHLKSGEFTKAAAMRETQLAFIRSADYAKPVFWAPFILMGNWR